MDPLPAEPQGKPKNTGVGSLSLLQWIFLNQELNWGRLHCRQILYQLSYQGSLFKYYFEIKLLKYKNWLFTKKTKHFSFLFFLFKIYFQKIYLFLHINKHFQILLLHSGEKSDSKIKYESRLQRQIPYNFTFMYGSQIPYLVPYSRKTYFQFHCPNSVLSNDIFNFLNANLIEASP